MDPREESIPRISLSNVSDWERLKNNYATAARTRLGDAIEEDSLEGEQAALDAHLMQFLEKTFNLAQPNLRVNGQNYEDINMEELNTEPFDEALDRRVWSLAATRMQWQKRIAEMRQKMPKEMEAVVLELVQEERAMDIAELEKSAPDDGDDPMDEEDTEAPVRYQEITDTFRQTIALGEELEQTIPNQEERAQRVTKVEEEVHALKP